MDYNFVVIEGNIGAGKTTLSRMLASQFNAKLIVEEFNDNPFLPQFYENPERYSFPLELSFLAERYHQLKTELTVPDMFKNFVVADYYFMKSLIFAKANLPADEFNLYRKLFNIIYQHLPKPDLYVFLNLTTDNLLKNIAKRGRDYEKNMASSYLDKIREGYFDYFRQYTDMRFLIIDTNNIDFVQNPEDYELIRNTIFEHEYPKGITRVVLKSGVKV